MENKTPVQKKKSPMPWMILFLIGFAVFFLIGHRQYAALGYARPLMDGDLHHALFDNVPFYISKVLGANIADRAHCSFAMISATFFLVVSCLLFASAYTKKGLGALASVGMLLLGIVWCNGIIGSALYVGEGKMRLLAWVGLLVYLAYIVLLFATGETFQNVVAMQLAGLGFTIAVAGYTRGLWNIGFGEQSVLPLRAANLLARFVQRDAAGVMSLVWMYLFFALLVVLLLVCSANLINRFREADKTFMIFGYAAVIVLFLFTCGFSDNNCDVQSVKHWFAIVATALMLGMTSDTKKLRTAIVALFVPVLLFAIIRAAVMYFVQFEAVAGNLVAKLLVRREAFIAKIGPVIVEKAPFIADDMSNVDVGIKALAVIATLVVTLVASLVLGWRYKKLNLKDTKLSYIPDRREYGAMMLWSGLFLLGLTVRCMDWEYRFVSIAAYIIFSVGAVGLVSSTFACIRYMDFTGIRLHIWTYLMLALLIPFDAFSALELGLVAAAVIGAKGVLDMAQAAKAGGAGAGGGSDKPGFLERAAAAVWMTQSLKAIDAEVASGKTSYYEGVYAAQQVVQAGKAWGVLGDGDKE